MLRPAFFRRLELLFYADTDPKPNSRPIFDDT